MLVLRNNRMAPRRTTPTLDNFLNELFNEDFFNWGRLSGLEPASGPTNVYEDKSKLIIETELPGVSREDISVRLEDGILTISGEVKRDEELNSEQFLREGRRYGKFERRFQLPDTVEVEGDKQLSAKLERGILRISLPLKQSLQPESYEIKVN